MSESSNVEEISTHDLGELVSKAQNRDAGAFHELFELLTNRLFSYALSHTKSREDSLDIVQETFIELWGALPKFSYRSRPEFYGFVYIILKRRLYRYRNKANKTVELEEHHIVDNYEEIEIEDYRYLEKLMKSLPEKYQELIHLRYWAELSFREIAAYMSINENTAKVWHHRALKALQREGNIFIKKYEV